MKRVRQRPEPNYDRNKDVDVSVECPKFALRTKKDKFDHMIMPADVTPDMYPMLRGRRRQAHRVPQQLYSLLGC
jgi:hypothetical protein